MLLGGVSVGGGTGTPSPSGSVHGRKQRAPGQQWGPPGAGVEQPWGGQGLGLQRTQESWLPGCPLPFQPRILTGSWGRGCCSPIWHRSPAAPRIMGPGQWGDRNPSPARAGARTQASGSRGRKQNPVHPGNKVWPRHAPRGHPGTPQQTPPPPIKVLCEEAAVAGGPRRPAQGGGLRAVGGSSGGRISMLLSGWGGETLPVSSSSGAWPGERG